MHLELLMEFCVLGSQGERLQAFNSLVFSQCTYRNKQCKTLPAVHMTT